MWANNGDSVLKSVDLESKQITRLASFPGGLMDGVTNGPNGSWLVSHNQGRLSQVSARGEVTVLLDLTVPGTVIADFAYIPEKNLLVLPTFFDNRVVAETLTVAR